MRIFFDTLSHPKRIAKRLAKVEQYPLHTAQEAIARIYGYSNWFELQKVTATKLFQSSKPDELCSDVVCRSRYLYQCRQYEVAINELLPEHEYEFAEIIIEYLRPTKDYSYSSSDISKLLRELFPLDWSSATLNDDDCPFPVSSRCIVKTGVEAKTFANLMNIDERLDASLGVRILESYACEDIAEKNEDDLLGTLVFRVRPITEENIVTIFEIEILGGDYREALHPTTLNLIGSQFIDYLSHFAYVESEFSNISLAFQGIKFILKGFISNYGLLKLIDEIDAIFEDCVELANDEFNLIEQMGIDFRDSEPFLHISSFENLLKISHSLAIMADQVEYLVSKITEVGEVMECAPKLLSDILVKQDQNNLAEFAEAQKVDSPANTAKFVNFVCSLHSGHIISYDLCIFFTHYFCDLLAAKLEPQNIENEISTELFTGAFISRMHEQAAKSMECTFMQNLYCSKMLCEIMDSRNKGEHEILVKLNTER